MAYGDRLVNREPHSPCVSIRSQPSPKDTHNSSEMAGEPKLENKERMPETIFALVPPCGRLQPAAGRVR